jgi:dynein heavy chain, axonemal
LELLKQEPSVLLEDDLLVKTLSESREVEQIIAGKLRVIEQASHEMQRSREVYAQAAHRAAHMFFVVKSLINADQMFRYSLREFMETFNNAIERSNIATNRNPSKII